MNTENDLTIAIVSYNSFSAIASCLSELIDSNKYPIIIVDNASTDNSADLLKQRFPKAEIIKSEVNLGYGRAANTAIQYCTTKYFFLINPDLKATSSLVANLLNTFHTLSDDVALLAPATAENVYTKSGLLEKDWVIGAAMVFNLDTLKKVGYFDENIFLFSEETDLCKRIKDAKYKILLDSNIYIEHLYRQSSTPNKETEALKDWHQAWSKRYFHHKHGTDVGKNNPVRIVAQYYLKYILATDSEKRLRYKYRFLGALAFLKGIPAYDDNGEPHVPTG